MRPLSRLARLAALSALLLNACYPPGDGKAPPLDDIYFPTGLALDGSWSTDDDDETKAPKYLYLANSDFDLQYRSSSVISYDLGRLSDVIPRSCNTTDDCRSSKGQEWVCDTLTPGDTRVPSYFCVKDAAKPCGDFGERDEANNVLYPGRCNSIDPLVPQDGSGSLRVDSVGIGAFASDLIWRPNCENKEDDVGCVANPKALSRLFVPVRGDSTLHWIDVTDGHLNCGAGNGDEDGCDAIHRSGDTPDDNDAHLEQKPEPFGVDATDNGEFIAVTNQTSGTVSLYHNDARTGEDRGGPKLVSIASGLPFAPIGVAAIPTPKFADARARYAPGFLVTYRSAPQIDLLRVRDPLTDTDDALAAYTRYVFVRGGSVPVNANSLNFDQRGIAIDDSARLKDYDACVSAFPECAAPADCKDNQAYVTCLKSARQPSVYAASRAPASVLVGAMTTDLNYVSGTSELPSFNDSISLTVGPSRVVVGDVRVPGSKFNDEFGGFDVARRLFIVCFDSRRIFVYDPERGAIEAIVSTGRGPHALAVDSERALAYVGHFTDSYLGVISLDLRFPKTYAAIIASIGTPKAPRSSK